jgi:hypothetical protein
LCSPVIASPLQCRCTYNFVMSHVKHFDVFASRRLPMVNVEHEIPH